MYHSKMFNNVSLLFVQLHRLHIKNPDIRDNLDPIGQSFIHNACRLTFYNQINIYVGYRKFLRKRFWKVSFCPDEINIMLKARARKWYHSLYLSHKCFATIAVWVKHTDITDRKKRWITQIGRLISFSQEMHITCEQINNSLRFPGNNAFHQEQQMRTL